MPIYRAINNPCKSTQKGISLAMLVIVTSLAIAYSLINIIAPISHTPIADNAEKISQCSM